ncbi:MAG TPA: sugar-binding domain-containing protein [Jiangellaceae bacterium]|nr:sugar-binding domain-containing protein [Jiangellaceae bacterium]
MDSTGARGRERQEADAATARFPVQLMYEAASLYYLEDATQADIARRLDMSRPTVSRLLSEARRTGVVHIEIRQPPSPDDDELAARAAEVSGLAWVYLSPGTATGLMGAALAPALSEAITDASLQPGDVLLVSSGRTVYEAAQATLPQLPGVVLAPTVGGQDEPEAWYQTNEITRAVAAKVGGRPTFLYAPALPGPDLHQLLLDEPSIRRVVELWEQASCVILGVGAPPLHRQSIPQFVPIDALSLGDAVGDVCSRFFDRDGNPVEFPGSDRLIATGLDVLQRIPYGIAVAAGVEKAPALLAGARAGYFNRLVTDSTTARSLVELADNKRQEEP